jgi:hypothetical protein
VNTNVNSPAVLTFCVTAFWMGASCSLDRFHFRDSRPAFGLREIAFDAEADVRKAELLPARNDVPQEKLLAT